MKPLAKLGQALFSVYVWAASFAVMGIGALLTLTLLTLREVQRVAQRGGLLSLALCMRHVAPRQLESQLVLPPLGREQRR